jgi:hypothetical protein
VNASEIFTLTEMKSAHAERGDVLFLNISSYQGTLHLIMKFFWRMFESHNGIYSGESFM